MSRKKTLASSSAVWSKYTEIQNILPIVWHTQLPADCSVFSASVSVLATLKTTECVVGVTIFSQLLSEIKCESRVSQHGILLLLLTKVLLVITRTYQIKVFTIRHTVTCNNIHVQLMYNVSFHTPLTIEPLSQIVCSMLRSLCRSHCIQSSVWCCCVFFRLLLNIYTEAVSI